MKTLSYESAVRLKAHGFPQKTHTLLSIPRMGIQETDHADIPPLEELIEEIGERFIGITKLNQGWHVSALNPDRENGLGSCIDVEDDNLLEALAALYCAGKESRSF